VAGTLSAEWLSSQGGSPRILHPLPELLNSCNSLSFPVSWYSTASLTWTTFYSVPLQWAPHPGRALPLRLYVPGILLGPRNSLGFGEFSWVRGIPLDSPATVLLSFPLRRPWVVKLFIFVNRGRRRVCVLFSFCFCSCLSLRAWLKVLLRLAFVLCAIRGKGVLWVRRVWFFPWGGEAGCSIPDRFCFCHSSPSTWFLIP